jgi:hydroxymethylpyrimidine kinase/phosphomethylpyrimidine kinase/thiamine-phosphate diphosphorylase
MIQSVLTIAGSDPSGGAGIQADLKTLASLGVPGLTVLSALTAQNANAVLGVFHVPAYFVALQLDAVLPKLKSGVVKTGMLGNAETVGVVAAKLREYGVERLVIDPVLSSSSGTRLLDRPGVDLLKTRLLPLATLITPNLAEAAELTGLRVRDVAGMERAARRLHELGARNVLVKGGHLQTECTDVFFDGLAVVRFEGRRIPTPGVRGTGCMLSSAIAAYMARKTPLLDAIRLSKEYVAKVIASSSPRQRKPPA